MVKKANKTVQTGLETKQILLSKSSILFVLQNIKLVILLVSIYFLLFWLFPIYSFIGLYALVGIIVGTLAKKYKDAFALSLAIGILSGILSSVFLTTDKFIYYAQTMPNSIVNRDTPMNLYTEVFFNIVKLNPISYLGKISYIFITIILITTFSILFNKFELKKIAIHSFLAILCINFLITSIVGAQSFIDYSSIEPPNYSYGYDAHVYLKTTYLMNKLPYYKSFVSGWTHDGRNTIWAEKGIKMVENGQIRLAYSNFTEIKQPYIFYFWKYIGLGNLSRVVYASIFFCILLIVLSYYSANKLIGNYAFVAPILIYPYLFTGTTWVNVFFPDWWAGLFLLLSLFLWIFDKFWLSSISFLFSLWSRLILSPILVFFAIFAFLKKRKALKPLLIALIIFIISLIAHYFQANMIISPSIRQNLYQTLLSNHAYGPVTGRFKSNLNLSIEYLAGFSYLMFLYGFFKISLFIFSFLSFIFPIIKKRIDLLIIVSYSVIDNLIRTGTYWGQHTGAAVLFSVALFIGYIANIQINSIKSNYSKTLKIKK